MSVIEKINQLYVELNKLNSSEDTLTTAQILDVFYAQFKDKGPVRDAAPYLEQLLVESETYIKSCELPELQQNTKKQVALLNSLLKTVEYLSKIEQALEILTERDNTIASLTETANKIKLSIEKCPDIDETTLEEDYITLNSLHEKLEQEKRGDKADQFLAPIYSDKTQHRKEVLSQLKRRLSDKIVNLQWSRDKINLNALQNQKKQALTQLKEHDLIVEGTPSDEELGTIIDSAKCVVAQSDALLSKLNDINNQLSGYSAYHQLPAELEALRSRLSEGAEDLKKNSTELVAFTLKDTTRSEHWQQLSSTVSSSLEPLKLIQQKKAELESKKSTSIQQIAYSWVNLSAWTDSKKFKQQAAEQDSLIEQELEYLSLLENQQTLLKEQQELPKKIEKIEQDIETYSQLQFESNPELLFSNTMEIIHGCCQFLRIDTPNIEAQPDGSHCFATIQFIIQLTEAITQKRDNNEKIKQSATSLMLLLAEIRRIKSENTISPETVLLFKGDSLANDSLLEPSQIEEELERLLDGERKLKAYQARLADIEQNKLQKQQLEKEYKKTSRQLSKVKSSPKDLPHDLTFQSSQSCQKAIQASRLQLTELILQLEEIHLPESNETLDIRNIEKEVVSHQPQSQTIESDEDDSSLRLTIEKPAVKNEITPRNQELLSLLNTFVIEAPVIEAELKTWYQELISVAQRWLQQCDLSQQPNINQANQLVNLVIDLQQDIHFLQADADSTPVLQRYQELCPLVSDEDNDFAMLAPLLRFKPTFLINDVIAQSKIKVMDDKGSDEVKAFNKTIEELRHQGVALDHNGHAQEFQLVENAYRLINHIGTESQNGRDYSQALEGMKEDPHYQPLEKHRGAWGKFCETLAKLFATISQYFSDEPANPSNYKNSVFFFSTRTDQTFNDALSATLPVAEKKESSEPHKKKEDQDSESVTTTNKKQEIAAVL